MQFILIEHLGCDSVVTSGSRHKVAVCFLPWSRCSMNSICEVRSIMSW